MNLHKKNHEKFDEVENEYIITYPLFNLLCLKIFFVLSITRHNLSLVGGKLMLETVLSRQAKPRHMGTVELVNSTKYVS